MYICICICISVCAQLYTCKQLQYISDIDLCLLILSLSQGSPLAIKHGWLKTAIPIFAGEKHA